MDRTGGFADRPTKVRQTPSHAGRTLRERHFVTRLRHLEQRTQILINSVQLSDSSPYSDLVQAGTAIWSSRSGGVGNEKAVRFIDP